MHSQNQHRPREPGRDSSSEPNVKQMQQTEERKTSRRRREKKNVQDQERQTETSEQEKDLAGPGQRRSHRYDKGHFNDSVTSFKCHSNMFLTHKNQKIHVLLEFIQEFWFCLCPRVI